MAFGSAPGTLRRLLPRKRRVAPVWPNTAQPNGDRPAVRSQLRRKLAGSMWTVAGVTRGKVQNDDQVDWTAALRLFTGDVAYVWHAGVHAAEVAASLHNIGFQIRAQIIWSKQHFVFGC